LKTLYKILVVEYSTHYGIDMKLQNSMKTICEDKKVPDNMICIGEDIKIYSKKILKHQQI